MKIQVKTNKRDRSRAYVFLFLLLLLSGLMTACGSSNNNSTPEIINPETIVADSNEQPVTLPATLEPTTEAQPTTNPATATSVPTEQSTIPPEATVPASNESDSTPLDAENEILRAAAMANAIIAGVGEISLNEDNNSPPQIIIFEESHDSRAGQLEIAIMLTRLYRDYDLRYTALEGAFFTDPPVNVPGYDSLADANTLMDIAVQLLREGEISSAEFMAMALPEMTVQGIEDKNEYADKTGEDASSAPILYLFYIALPSTTNTEIEEFNELYEADKILEAVEFIISTDEWTQEQYEKITDNTTILSAEEWLVLMNEIEAKAEEIGAEIDEDTAASFQDYTVFFATVSQRSDTMVRNTMTLLAESPDAPIAMIIGAAHTARVVELFTEQDVSFVVIRPTALLSIEGTGELNLDAYERKLQSQSVDEEGELGALLDGRKKPPTVLQQHWFRVKSEVLTITTRIARAVAEGGEIPFNTPPYDLQTAFANFKYVSVNWDSIVITDDEPENEVVFSLNVQADEAGTIKTIWVRAVQNSSLSAVNIGISATVDVKSMEELLLEALEQVRAEPSADDVDTDVGSNNSGEGNATESNSDVPEEGTVTSIAHDVSAMYSTTQDGVSTAIGTG